MRAASQSSSARRCSTSPAQQLELDDARAARAWPRRGDELRARLEQRLT